MWNLFPLSLSLEWPCDFLWPSDVVSVRFVPGGLGLALKKLYWTLLPTKVSYFSMCLSFKPPTKLHTCQRWGLFLFVHPQSPVRSLWIAEKALVERWLRICLAMQGTWVPPLVRELRTHMCPNCWAHVHWGPSTATRVPCSSTKDPTWRSEDTTKTGCSR